MRRGRRKEVVARIPVVPREVLKDVKKFKSVKDLSWYLLDDVLGDMDPDGVDDFAQFVFEEALDYKIGLAVLQIFRAAAEKKKIPKPFYVDVLSDGDVEISWE